MKDQDLIAEARHAFGREQFALAEQRAREALAANGCNVDALEILFLCQQRFGDGAGAERTLRQVIALAPDKQWPRGDLARLLLGMGRSAEAAGVLREAIAIDADHADAHAMLGALLSEQELLVPGAWHLQRAIALAGRHPQLLANLGRNLMRQGKLDEAEPLLEAAVAAMPDALMPIIHLAELAEQRDAFDRAVALLDRAEPLALRQGSDVLAQRAYLLSRTPAWREGLALLDAVPALTGTPRLLRARLRDRAERYAYAWQDAVAAKATLADARGHAYDTPAVQRDFAALTEFARRVAGDPGASPRTDLPQPIFILGLPRSGTTLTEQVLASHSRICAGGELPFAATFRTLIERAVGLPFADALLRIADASNLWPQLRDHYLAGAQSYGLLESGVDFFTDKMPLNEVYLPLLRLAFPEAHFITVHRDPRDVAVSMMLHDMTHGFHCAYRLTDVADHLAGVAALTEHYRDMGLRTYDLGYERFVHDQADETDRLMTYLGLETEPAQRAFHRNRRHAPTPSYAQVREPLHDRSIGRWRNYAERLAPVMDKLAADVAR